MTDTNQEPQEIVVADQTPSTDLGAPAEVNILQFAMQQGAGVDQLRALMEMQERMEDREAEKAFVVSMAEFKKDPPMLYKDKTVAYGGTSYSHISLPLVCGVLVPALSKVGISHAWQTDQTGDLITVTCTLTHKNGHSQSNSMSSGKDGSGKKNAIQEIASAITYLQRYTFLAAVGMSAADQDDDGNATSLISDEQFEELTAMINEADADTQQFCKHFGCDSVKVLLVSKFGEAQNILRTKIRKNKKESTS